MIQAQTARVTLRKSCVFIQLGKGHPFEAKAVHHHADGSMRAHDGESVFLDEGNTLKFHILAANFKLSIRRRLKVVVVN